VERTWVGQGLTGRRFPQRPVGGPEGRIRAFADAALPSVAGRSGLAYGSALLTHLGTRHLAIHQLGYAMTVCGAARGAEMLIKLGWM